MSESLSRSWTRIAAALGSTLETSGTRKDLLSRYAEPWRKYHTLQHLEECLAWFEASSQLAERPHEVEAALWFHDAIYDPRRADNEALSATLAETSLLAAGAPAQVAARVMALVMATGHTAEPASADEQLLVDIDLSILGASPHRFAQYEQQIRAEYAFVPAAVFREKRGAILRAFLLRPRLYSTEYFHSRLEKQARVNLAGAAGTMAP
jgi:predicted metal-dependent HD superfamily phosphohydrolase